MTNSPKALIPEQGSPKRDDISRNARSLARLADRLPAGKRYVVLLTKPDRKGGPWRVDIAEIEQSLELSRRARPSEATKVENGGR